MQSKIIAIDFDGTIVEDAYPNIGKPMMFAFETMKLLQKNGFRLILWTYRSGDKLQEAVNFCKKNGLEFYAVNSNYQGEVFEGNDKSRKINANIFIDDRNLGGFPGWGEAYQIIKDKIEFSIQGSNIIVYSKKKNKTSKNLFLRLLGK